MCAFSASLASQIHWTTDRGAATPADFGDSVAEHRALSENAAWIDFSHISCVLLAGPERLAFLGGLVTNQVRHVSNSRSVYAAMLSPQGRYLWDFTMVDYMEEQLILVTEPDRVPELLQQIAMYILRAKVSVTDVRSSFGVLAVAGPAADQVLQRLFPSQNLANAELGATFVPEEGLRLWRDPRHPGFGWRLLLPISQLGLMRERLSVELSPAGFTAWEAYRIKQSLPRGGNELMPGETLALEAGLLELNGVDFGKGCYVGQETTARSHHRATLKKRLFQVTFKVGEVVLPGTPVLLADGKEAGIITSSASQIGTGLAILRLAEVASNQSLIAHEVAIIASKPVWATWI